MKKKQLEAWVSSQGSRITDLDLRLSTVEYAAEETQTQLASMEHSIDRLGAGRHAADLRILALEEAVIRLAGNETKARKVMNHPPVADAFSRRYQRIVDGKLE